MKTKITFLVLTLIFLSFSVFAQDIEQLLAEGDGICAGMITMEQAKEAKAKYEKALLNSGEEDKYKIYWRIARILYYIGDHTEGKREKQAIFLRGIYNAEKAAGLDPSKPDGYYWLGVNNGRFGEAKGVLKSLSLVKPIKEAMNKIIEIDRGYEGGGADRVMGRLFFKVPGFAGGNKDKSLEHLKKSKEFDPEDPVTRVYLAETLMSLKKYDEAKAELDYVLNMADDPCWVIGIREQKEAAKELFAKLEKKMKK